MRAESGARGGGLGAFATSLFDLRATVVAPAASAAPEPAPGSPRFLAPSGRRGDILRELLLLRTVAAVGQAMALGLASLMGLAVPLAWTAVIVVVVVVFNVLASMGARRQVHDGRYSVAAQLAFDLVAFTLMIALTGGLANPFAVLFVLHAALISLVLPYRQAVAGVAAVLLAIVVGWLCFAPLHYDDGRRLQDALLQVGVVGASALAVIMTGWFGARVVRVVRTQDRLLHESVRQAANAETLLRLGSLAAGAAHELASPLSTIAVIAGEMRRLARSADEQRDAAILGDQVAVCRRIIDDFRNAAGHATTESGSVPLDEFLHSALAVVKATRPDASIEACVDGARPVPAIAVNPGLKQTLMILLNNAADASPRDVHLDARWDAERLMLTVSDRGTGFTETSLEKLGRRFFTTKSPGKGMGLGLVLASSAVARLGGTLRWSNRADGGARADLVLPLAQLIVNPGG
jgi:two-component system sensor histidine kinase RegB